MSRTTPQVPLSRVLALAARQHGPFGRDQLLALGLTRSAIEHRLGRGRLHPIHRGVYALVPADQLSREGGWMAAVLGCCTGALLSDESAAWLWGIREGESRGTEVTVPVSRTLNRAGITVHRRSLARVDATRRDRIPVTNIAATLLALAARLPAPELERAISQASYARLITPEQLRVHIDTVGRRKGVAMLRATLDRHTFTLTDTELERWFIPIAVRAGLPKPLTQHHLNGFRVDFYFPSLGLVVETDGLRSHRTAIEQTRDRIRDQTHAAAGLTPLRFTHWQVRHERQYVEATLASVAARLPS